MTGDPLRVVTSKQQLAELASYKLRELSGEDMDDEVTQARRKAKAGNPLPLCALQWPELVVNDPQSRDVEIFEGTVGDPDDPCLKIDPWQRRALKATFAPEIGEICMKGCTGAGKGFITSLCLNLMYDVYDEVCRISITSETSRHAQTTLFAEFATWRGKMAHPGPGRLLGGALQDSPKHYVQVLNPSPHGAGEAFSGQHASDGQTVYAFDEASAVPEIHYTNCLKNATKIFALSNPRITEGWFRDSYRPLQGDGTKAERRERENTTGECVGRLAKRLCFTIDGMSCTNVKHSLLKAPVAPPRGIEINGTKYSPAERISEDDFEHVRARVPGQIDLNQYQNIIDTSKEKWEVECYAHAQFPSEDPIRQAILPSWLGRHIEAWKKRKPAATCFGLDVARSHSGDDTVLTAGSIDGVADIHEWKASDNTVHVKKVLSLAKEHYDVDLTDGQSPVCVEMGGGYGGGVADRLRELGVWIIEFIPAGGALYKRGIYLNQRAEWYILLGERLSPEGNWSLYPFAVPPHDRLHEELCSPLKMPAAQGTAWKLEPKEAITKRLDRSPDRADSMVCFYRAVYERHELFDVKDQAGRSIIAGSTEDSDDALDTEEEVIGEDGLPAPRMTKETSDPLEDWLADEDDLDDDDDLDDEEDDGFGGFLSGGDFDEPAKYVAKYVDGDDW